MFDKAFAVVSRITSHLTKRSARAPAGVHVADRWSEMARILKARRREICPLCRQWVTFGQLIMKNYATNSWAHKDCVLTDLRGEKGTTSIT